MSVLLCRIPEASTSSRSTPMAAPPSVTIAGPCSTGSCTRGWSVTVSEVFLLLPKGASGKEVGALDNSFLLCFSGKYHLKCQLFIALLYFKGIFQYYNNLQMKITSSAESMVHSARWGFGMAILRKPLCGLSGWIQSQIGIAVQFVVKVWYFPCV